MKIENITQDYFSVLKTIMEGIDDLENNLEEYSQEEIKLQRVQYEYMKVGAETLFRLIELRNRMEKTKSNS